MLAYQYITDTVDDGKSKQIGKLHIRKNRSGTNTIITKSNGEKFLMVDLEKLYKRSNEMVNVDTIRN